MDSEQRGESVDVLLAKRGSRACVPERFSTQHFHDAKSMSWDTPTFTAARDRSSTTKIGRRHAAEESFQVQSASPAPSAGFVPGSVSQCKS
jgi:hypothetical protein